MAGDLGHALEADAALTSSTSLRTWEETVVAPDDGDAEGGDAMEMRFSLPAAPSPAVLMLLLATCRELERAGKRCLAAYRKWHQYFYDSGLLLEVLDVMAEALLFKGVIDIWDYC